MRNEIDVMMAALISKLSPAAQAKRNEITNQIRELALETLEISISEMRRLNAQGKDYSAALASFCVVKQQFETEDIRNPVGMSELGLMLDAGKSDASEYFAPLAQRRKREIDGRMLALAGEDMDLMEQELLRLSLETSGRQGVDYAVAASLVAMMRQQMCRESDLNDPHMTGVLGTVMGVVRSAAKDEAQKKSQGN